MSEDMEGNDGEGVDPRFVLSLAANELGAGDFEDALERVRRVQPLIGDDQALLAPSRALEARALAALGRGEEALLVLDRAIDEAGRAGAEVHARGLSGLRQKLEQTLEMTRMAAISPDDIERQTPDAKTRAVLFSNKIVALLATGELEQARMILPRAREAAEEADEPGALLPVLLATAQLCVATDDTHSANRALEAARALAVRFEPDAVALIDEMTGFLQRTPDV
jgi:tetratricopeptide (TPR) repeat protein